MDTPSALASFASFAGAMGVRERGVLMGAEESKERGLGPIEGVLVVVGTGVRVVSGLDGSGLGFGRGTRLFREDKEGTGAAVVQDIGVDLLLLYDYPLGTRQHRAEERWWEGGEKRQGSEWRCSLCRHHLKQIKWDANRTVN